MSFLVYGTYAAGALISIFGLFLTSVVIRAQLRSQSDGRIRVEVGDRKLTIDSTASMFGSLVIFGSGVLLIVWPSYRDTLTFWTTPSARKTVEIAKEKTAANNGGSAAKGEWVISPGSRSAAIFRAIPFEDNDVRRYVRDPIGNCKTPRTFKVCYSSGKEPSVIAYGPVGPNRVTPDRIALATCTTLKRYCYLIMERRSPSGRASGTFEEIR